MTSGVINITKAENYYQAVAMDRAAAFGWYGAWGPRFLVVNE